MKKAVNIMLIMCVVMSMVVYAQGIKLEYKFEKGKTYRYRDILEAKSTQEMMGREIKTEIQGINVVRVMGDSLNPDGSMVLIASTDSAVMSVKAPGMDTTQTPTNVIGKKFRMNVAKNGRVSNFASLNVTEGEEGESMQNQLGHYPLLGENPVTIGSTWNASTIDTVEQKQFGGKLITDTKEEYKIVGKEMKNGYDCFTIASTGKFTIAGKGSMMGMDLHIEGTGKTDGMIFFNPAQGIVVASESNVDMEMTIATTGQTPMVIPTTQSMKITRSLIP